MNQNAVKLTKNQELEGNSEAGGIIIWIMIMVALFAALSYAVSQGSRSGTQSISSEQASLAATEILDYATAVKRVVQELQINGCSDTEISFENNVVSGYTNPNSPSDNSCHIFHPNGGGLQYLNFSSDRYDSTYNGQSNFQENIFTGAVAVEGIGTSSEDLIFTIPYVQSSICENINEKMDMGTTMPIDIYTASKFTGGFSASTNPIIGDDAPLLEDKSVFCARREASTYHYFGQVLIAR